MTLKWWGSCKVVGANVVTVVVTPRVGAVIVRTPKVTR